MTLLLPQDKRYRLRFINAAGLNCPVRLLAPTGHNFTVLATDGANIAAFYTHSLLIYNGKGATVLATDGVNIAASKNTLFLYITVRVSKKLRFLYTIGSAYITVRMALAPTYTR